jgi:hypothetical protein
MQVVNSAPRPCHNLVVEDALGYLDRNLHTTLATTSCCWQHATYGCSTALVKQMELPSPPLLKLGCVCKCKYAPMMPTATPDVCIQAHHAICRTP